MKYYFKGILLMVLGVFTMTISCQKEETVIQHLDQYKVPSIETARTYYNENINLTSFETTYQLRTDNGSFNPDWDNSKEKKYKDQPQENVDILYTPIYLPTSGQAKSFIGSIEVNGEMQSRIFVLLYLESENTSVFSGFMFIYSLDGLIEYAYKYVDGQRVAEGLPSTNSLNRNANDPDCDSPFDSIGCLLDWVGGDWFGIDGYLENEEVVILAAGDSSTGGFNDADWANQSISIPALDDEWNGSNGSLDSPWWNANRVTANPVSLIMALGLAHISMPEAQWLLNEATQEQLQNIANMLNDNRVKDGNTTPSDFENDGVNQNQMTEISQDAINFALFIINVMMDNSGASFEFQPDLIPSSNYQNFDNLDEIQDFFDALYNPTFTSEIIIDENDPQRIVTKFRADLSIFAFLDIFITQNIDAENQVYEVLEVSSAMSGITIGLVWEQDAWDYDANQYVATINIYGHADAILFFESIGSVFSEHFHYQVVIDVTDGSPISVQLIND